MCLISWIKEKGPEVVNTSLRANFLRCLPAADSRQTLFSACHISTSQDFYKRNSFNLYCYIFKITFNPIKCKQQIENLKKTFGWRGERLTRSLETFYCYEEPVPVFAPFFTGSGKIVFLLYYPTTYNNKFITKEKMKNEMERQRSVPTGSTMINVSYTWRM